MAAKKSAKKTAKVKTIPKRTDVEWPYRGTHGHGEVTGIAKKGTTAANTEYDIKEFDHHVSASGSREKPIVKHYGRVLTRSSARAAKGGKARGKKK